MREKQHDGNFHFDGNFLFNWKLLISKKNSFRKIMKKKIQGENNVLEKSLNGNLEFEFCVKFVEK